MDLPEHFVEGAGELADLVAGVELHARGVFARTGHAARRGRQDADRAGDDRLEPAPECDRDQHRDREHDGQHLELSGETVRKASLEIEDDDDFAETFTVEQDGSLDLEHTAARIAIRARGVGDVVREELSVAPQHAPLEHVLAHVQSRDAHLRGVRVSERKRCGTVRGEHLGERLELRAHRVAM